MSRKQVFVHRGICVRIGWLEGGKRTSIIFSVVIFSFTAEKTRILRWENGGGSVDECCAFLAHQGLAKYSERAAGIDAAAEREKNLL